MATATLALVQALRTTADRLARGATYQWTHMGACNCGHLAQTLTHLDRAELHALALMRAGDWGEQAIDHCPTSGLPIDDVIGVMLDAGMELRDIGELERLAAPEIVARLPHGERELDRRDRADVVRYLRAWADLLEERLERVERSGEHEIASDVLVRRAS